MSLLGIFVGIYLIGISIKGKGMEFLNMLKQDTYFIKFLLSALVLYFATQIHYIRPFVDLILPLFFLAFLIVYIENIKVEINNIRSLFK